jgi:hypothetical protein
MELPTPTDRPKGFWRRNWVPLFLVIPTFYLSICDFVYSVTTDTHQFNVLAFDGHIAFLQLQNPSRLNLTRDSLHWPSFGTSPSMETIANGIGWLFLIPVWLLFVFLAVWIAFREWRRHRKQHHGIANPN